MTRECHDHRHLEFARYLECKAELVEEVFLEIGVDKIPDREQLHELNGAISLYKKAVKSVQTASKALDELPEVEKLSHSISKQNLPDQLSSIINELKLWLAAALRHKAQFRGGGPSNPNADAFAEFVASLFEQLGKDIRLGAYPGTNEPNTEFGRAVKKGITIYDIRHVPEVREQYIKAKGGLEITDKTVFSGAAIDWRRPAEKAFRKRNS